MIKEETVIKLNLGSGPTGIPGWLNYDWGVLPALSKFNLLSSIVFSLKLLPQSYNVKWPPIELVNIKKKLPLDANTVDYIYCSHVLEHFEIWETMDILKECRRVLKPGGVLRIIVPDIEKLVNIYLEDTRSHSLSRPGRNLCNMWWGYEKDILPLTLIQKVARSFTRDHQWNYDREELTFILENTGFMSFNFLSIYNGEVPDIDKLDQPGVERTSIYVEAKK